MKHLSPLFWKGYFFLWLWLSVGDFMGLISHRADTYLFYHTLMAFAPTMTFYYAAALCAAVLSVISLWPIYARAFAVPRSGFTFFKCVLALRLAADVCGHDYDVLFLRASAVNNMILAGLAVLVTLAIVLPSYKALFDHAFNVASRSPVVKRNPARPAAPYPAKLDEQDWVRDTTTNPGD